MSNKERDNKDILKEGHKKSFSYAGDFHLKEEIKKE